MMSERRSATLFREGPDLDALLAELDEEHDGRVRVVDVTYGRDGGVLGFFAKRRVGVHFAVEEADGGPAVDADAPPAAPTRFAVSARADALEDLVLAAERAESRARPSSAGGRARAEHIVESGQVPADDGADGDAQPNVEFARMLIELATAKAAERESATADRTPDRPAEPFVPVALPSNDPDATASTVSVAPLAPLAPLPPAPPAPRVRVPAPAWTPPAPAPRPAAVAPAAWTAPPPRAGRTPAGATAPSAPVAPAVPPASDAAPARHAAPDRIGRHAATVEPAADPAVDPIAKPIAEPIARPRRARHGAHRASPSEEGSRTEYTLRRQLAEAGVPVAWIPERTADAYWVVEQLVSRVGCVGPLSLAPGEILVIAGPGAEALETARTVLRDLHLPADALAAVGYGDGVHATRIDQRWQALATVADVQRRRDSPLVVALDTDRADPAWVRTMVAACAPDVLWHVVDATRKPVDARLAAARLGRRVDALVVVNAARTASPASVWELDVPIALVDGRPATRGTWAVLLIDTLAALGG